MTLLGQVPVVRDAGGRRPAARRRGRRAAPLRRPAGHLPRGRRQRHVLHRALRPRPRGPRAPRRAHDHARALRPRRHLRRAGDVRRRAPLGDRRDARRGRGARDRRRGHAAPAARAPRHRGRSSSSRSAAGCARPTSASPASPSRPCRAASRSCSTTSCGRPRPRARATRDVLVTITQADIAQLAGSSRESASRFLAVLERAGVITQGRGRITVHDPQALDALRLLTARGRADASSPPAASSYARRRVRRHRPDAARGRRVEGARAAQGPPRRRRDAPSDAALREVREEAGVEARSSRSSATSATGTCATGGGSPRS